MLFAPRSGGVKRYLTAKSDWFQRRRPGVRHTLVVPGHGTGSDEGLYTIAAARLPFADGYRWPASVRNWRAFDDAARAQNVFTDIPIIEASFWLTVAGFAR